jgi:hypothetical protein
MATPPCRFCINCKAGIAGRMTPKDMTRCNLQLE